MSVSSMGFTEGMLVGMNKPTFGRNGRVLDWEKAEKVCSDTKKPVWAGLMEDWDCTHGQIAKEGNVHVKDFSLWVYSRWATPCLMVGDEWNGEVIECWVDAPAADTSADYPESWIKADEVGEVA